MSQTYAHVCDTITINYVLNVFITSTNLLVFFCVVIAAIVVDKNA